MAKTVIILGAGFSVGTHLPMQNSLLNDIDTFVTGSTNTDLKTQWKSFTLFFKNNIGSDIRTYLIEDLFTIFDNCLIENEQFRGRNLRIISKANQALLHTMRDYLIHTIDANYKSQVGSFKKYSQLALELLKLRKKFGDEDKVSIISLNWDNYFEKMLTYRISTHNALYKNVSLDYCTYDYNFSYQRNSHPSIMKKAYGKTNFKILKPHGSVNWGYCSNCGRLYISYGKKIAKEFECTKYCNKTYSRQVKLSPIMITPTYLKDLTNMHLKSIWSNSSIEISEADRLVFIGYSLRPEDFYFRYMLAKNFKTKAEIKVYDYTDKTDPVDIDSYKRQISNKFEGFFQKATNVEVFVNGWENNIAEIVNFVDS